MALKFKVGDIVQLKSGGPAMTVAKRPEGGVYGENYLCQWFKGASKEQGHFVEDILQPYVAPKKV